MANVAIIAIAMNGTGINVKNGIANVTQENTIHALNREKVVHKRGTTENNAMPFPIFMPYDQIQTDKPHDGAKKYYYTQYIDIKTVYLTDEEKYVFVRRHWNVTLIPCE